jgi:predicted flap endonuclease-1-like 5' DNA nuclease
MHAAPFRCATRVLTDRPGVRQLKFAARGAAMSYSISDIEGIGPVIAERLRNQRIRTTAKLLEVAKNPKGRKMLAEKTGVEYAKILKFTNMADLMRIKGVGEEYTELLEAAGVDTVRELKFRNPHNLAKAMAVANKTRKLVRAVPSEQMIAKWVAQAKSLPMKITY